MTEFEGEVVETLLLVVPVHLVKRTNRKLAKKNKGKTQAIQNGKIIYFEGLAKG